MTRLVCDLVALLIVTVGGRALAAAPTEVLLVSGTTAPNGRVLSEFLQPIASARPTKVVFFGQTSAILREDGGVVTAIAKTGDPIPGLLDGTFNRFDDPTINDAGQIAFVGILNSRDAIEGLFLYDGGVLSTIFLSGGPSGGSIAPIDPDINAAGDLLFRDGAADALVFRDHASGVLTQEAKAGEAVPGGGEIFTFVGRAVLNASRRIAFGANIRGGSSGIFTKLVGGSLEVIAREGEPSPVAGAPYRSFGASVSLSEAGHVAFEATLDVPGPDTSAIFVFDPAGPSITTVARMGDVVDGEPIRDFNGRCLAVNSSGDMLFTARFGSDQRLVGRSGGVLALLTGDLANPADFSPRLTASGHAVWTSGGVQLRTREIMRFDGALTTVVGLDDATPIGLSVVGRSPIQNNSDVTVFRAEQGVLYALDRGTLVPLAAPGDPTSDGGSLRRIDVRAYRGSSIAFRAAENVGGELRGLIVLQRGDRPAEVVVRAGDASPLGGTLLVTEDALDVKGRTIVFSSLVDGGSAGSGLFRTRAGSGVIETLVKHGDPSPDGDVFIDFTAAQIVGREVVFSAQLESKGTGLFATRRGAIRAIAVNGEPAPGSGGGFYQLFAGPTYVASSDRVVFLTSFASALTSSGFLDWRGTEPLRLVAEGDAAPVAGRFLSFLEGFDSLALGGDLTAFTGTVTLGVSGSSFDGLFLHRASGIRTLLRSGDPTPLGGTFGSFSFGQSMSLVGSTLIHTQTLPTDNGVARGLFATDVR